MPTAPWENNPQNTTPNEFFKFSTVTEIPKERVTYKGSKTKSLLEAILTSGNDRATITRQQARQMGYQGGLEGLAKGLGQTMSYNRIIGNKRWRWYHTTDGNIYIEFRPR